MSVGNLNWQAWCWLLHKIKRPFTSWCDPEGSQSFKWISTRCTLWLDSIQDIRLSVAPLQRQIKSVNFLPQFLFLFHTLCYEILSLRTLWCIKLIFAIIVKLQSQPSWTPSPFTAPWITVSQSAFIHHQYVIQNVSKVLCVRVKWIGLKLILHFNNIYTVYLIWVAAFLSYVLISWVSLRFRLLENCFGNFSLFCYIIHQIN